MRIIRSPRRVSDGRRLFRTQVPGYEVEGGLRRWWKGLTANVDFHDECEVFVVYREFRTYLWRDKQLASLGTGNISH